MSQRAALRREFSENKFVFDGGTELLASSSLDKVRTLFDSCGLEHCCLQSNSKNCISGTTLWPFRFDEVLRACMFLVGANKHPALILGAKKSFPFDLFEFRRDFRNDGDVEALYFAFEQSKLLHVYGVPVKTGDHSFVVFLLARAISPICTAELLTYQCICHNAVVGSDQFDASLFQAKKHHKLSAQEKFALIGRIRELSDCEISKELGISELDLSNLFSQISSKLNTLSVSHSIAVSIIEGEILLQDCARLG